MNKKNLEEAKGLSPLPEELLQNSIIVSPKDKLLESVISKMRNNGLIMTKLDVRLKQVGKDKMHDLLENRNMGIICNERKLKKRNIKKNGFTILAKLG